MRPLLFLVPLLAPLLAGCHLLLGHQPGSGDPARADLAPGDLAPLPLDGPPREAASPPDQAPLLGCVAPDADALAVYTFDDPQSPYADSTGKHPIKEVVGVASAVGVSGCGGGVYVVPIENKASYLVIEHDSDWDKVLAIELWVRFDRDPPLEAEAILSRDAAGQAEPGHFTLFRDCKGRIVARLQQQTSQILLCSGASVPKNVWTKIVVNFHPPEVRVDGSTTSSSAPACAAWLPACSTTSALLGIEGNKNPWVVGASLISSPQGTTDLVTLGMEGTLDELRLSRVRR